MRSPSLLLVVLTTASCFTDSGTVTDTTGTMTSGGSSGSDADTSSSTTPDTGSATSSTGATTASTDGTSGGPSSFCDGVVISQTLLCEDFDGDPLRSAWTVTANNGGLIERNAGAAVSSPPNGLRSVISSAANSTATAVQTCTEDWNQPLDIELGVRVDEACPGGSTRLLGLDYGSPGDGVSYRLVVTVTAANTLEVVERTLGGSGELTQHASDQQLPVDHVGELRMIMQPGNLISVEIDGSGPDTFAPMLFPSTVPTGGYVNVILGLTTGAAIGPCSTSVDNLLISPHQ